MFRFLLWLLDWLYPRRCYLCGKTSENSEICRICFAKIPLLSDKPIKTLGQTKIYSSTEYKNNVKKIIRAVKYHHKKEFANELALLMQKLWENVPNKKPCYEIVPTPMFKKRIKKRGYDHIELIAKKFAEMNGYELNSRLIERIKDTKPQYKLSMKEREENLKNAFKVNVENYSKKPILLIDDICTTGSTINEMVKELKKQGIKDITALCCSCNESYVQN